MEKISLPRFYQLGATLTALAQLDPKEAGSNAVNQLFVAVRAAVEARTLLSEYPELNYCRTAGEKLDELFQRWYESWKLEHINRQSDVEYPIKIEAIVGQAKKFQDLLLEELQGLSIFRVAPTGIYVTVDLIERAELAFPETVRVKLAQQVIDEIRQSGRCLAFDNWTAAGFHAMRATEAVMHDYYVTVCKPKPKPKKRLDSWGAYTAAFDAFLKAKTPKAKSNVREVLALIQQIKDDYRNNIMHPQVVLTRDDALTLFGVSQTIITAMASKL